MSSGHRTNDDKPIDAKRAKELATYFRDPKFLQALAKYRTTDEKHDIPYLGGSSDDGTTIYFDRQFSKGVAAHKFPFDPRPFLRIHETVEGALLRLFEKPYEVGHDFATIAERQAVEAAGHKWRQYSDMLQPYIRTEEHEVLANPPDDILLLPYKGTRHFDKMRDGRMLSKKEANYRDKPNGTQRCKTCTMFRTPDRCNLVEGSIAFNGWCEYWEGK